MFHSFLFFCFRSLQTPSHLGREGLLNHARAVGCRIRSHRSRDSPGGLAPAQPSKTPALMSKPTMTCENDRRAGAGTSQPASSTNAGAEQARLEPVQASGRNYDKEKPPLLDVFIARVRPHHTHTIVQLLGQCLPLGDGMQHVKRVRRNRSEHASSDCPTARNTSSTPEGSSLDVLLARADAWPPTSPGVQELLSTHRLHPVRTQIPAIPPQSREQLERWGRVWPLIYRPKAPTPSPSSTEVQALENAAEGLAAWSQAPSRGASPRIRCATAAALVSLPAVTTIARAVDRSDPKSLQPSLRLRHAIMCCIEEAAATTSPLELSTDSLPMSSRGERSEEAYLCSGLGMIVLGEPCVMCAMALSHSRILRVVYIDRPRSTIGGFNEAAVHEEPALNHRYQAYQLITRTGQA